MIKDFSRTNTFLIGCSIPLVFFALYKASKMLGLDLDPVFEVIAAGFLLLSSPWSIPSFVFPRELGWPLGSSISSYIESASLVIGFGLNVLIFVKFGIRHWLISALAFTAFIIMLGVLFSLWMMSDKFM